MNEAQASKPNDVRLLEGTDEAGPPITESSCKRVMLRAERNDKIQIVEVVNRLQRSEDIPSEVEVVRRTNPYFGPKLVLSAKGSNYLLTAPGPDTQLLLWSGNYLDDGDRYGWNRLAEVTARFADDQPQYDLCQECGQPIESVEHERLAAFGSCPGLESY